MWSTPAHCGTLSVCFNFMLWGSRKSSRRCASATTIARRPSAVK
jgi:hypothetical protein